MPRSRDPHSDPEPDDRVEGDAAEVDEVDEVEAPAPVGIPPKERAPPKEKAKDDKPVAAPKAEVQEPERKAGSEAEAAYAVAPAERPPPGENDVVIEVKNVTAGYGEQVVVRDVSMTVRRGEIMAIVGGSGSGKSTLLKILIGLIKPDSGSVNVLGVDVLTATERAMEELYKRIGIVYQSGALFGSLTVAENVALPLLEHTKLARKIIDISVRMKLGLVNLSGFENRLPGALSGGQAKRVAFARSIAMDPEILFCDEPSAGLDPRIGRGLDDLIRNLNAAFNMAIVVVTHEMESVRVIADRIVMLAPMKGGARVVFEGTYDDLRACKEPVVADFVAREPLTEPRMEAKEILRALVGE
jgi:phospholipid/cholesterol/gamma-HCH transport system ATP-binding protein